MTLLCLYPHGVIEIQAISANCHDIARGYWSLVVWQLFEEFYAYPNCTIEIMVNTTMYLSFIYQRDQCHYTGGGISSAGRGCGDTGGLSYLLCS